MTLYQFPTIVAGDRMLTSTFTNLEQQFILKGNNTSRTNNTLADDPDLSFPVVANGIYLVEFGIYYDGLSAANITTRWDTPSGSTGLRGVMGPGSTAVDAGADNISGRFGVHGFGTSVTYSCARNGSNQQWAWESAVVAVGTTAGAVALIWAQATTNATATVVASNSWGRCARLA
jgi:hypothetical protein